MANKDKVVYVCLVLPDDSDQTSLCVVGRFESLARAKRAMQGEAYQAGETKLEWRDIGHKLICITPLPGVDKLSIERHQIGDRDLGWIIALAKMSAAIEDTNSQQTTSARFVEEVLALSLANVGKD